MRKSLCSSLGAIALLTVASSAVGTNVVITSFHQNGEITWSNDWDDVGTFRIEWGNDLSGAWTDSWHQQTWIMPTGTTMHAKVPMFYRVVASPAVEIDLDSYANMNTNATWVYARWHSDEGSTTTTAKVTVAHQFGRRVYAWSERDASGPTRSYWYLRDLSEALYQVGGQEQEAWCNDLDHPLPFLRRRFTPGVEYTSSGVGWAGDYSSWENEWPDPDGSYTNIVNTEKDTVTVSAGTYSNCWKLTVTIPPSPGNSSLLRGWYAKGVGYIKEYYEETAEGHSYTNTYELQSYDPGP